ncbi:MAG: hypothetical protein AAGF74_17830 [Pseudomonadota bacterium]
MKMTNKAARLIVGTVGCALATGWAMQTFVQRPGNAPTEVQAYQQTKPQFSNASVLGSISAPAVRIPPESEDVVARNETDLLSPADVANPPAEPDDPMLGCLVNATAEAGPRAMVTLSVDAPCFPNERVAIHHTGMMFTTISDPTGALEVSMPAMKEQAVFIVSIAEGFGTVVTAKVPDVKHWTRVALQWEGKTGFQIHAREFGAAYGSTGHVWFGAPNNPVSGSFLARLGDGQGEVPRIAEIYSFPRDADLRGLVTLTVETEVTDATCGRRLTAEALEGRTAGKLSSRQLDLMMPNCGSVGDFLVLNNLVDDLKIASN